MLKTGKRSAPCNCGKVHVILVAYACEPGAGSEAGVAWGLIRELSSKVHYTVITRANNKRRIEDVALTDEIADWIYLDLQSETILAVKRSRPLTMIYYVAWQALVALTVRRLQRSADYFAVHHLSLMSYLFVGAYFASPKRIIGPFGGLEQIPRHFWKRALLRPSEGLRAIRILFRWLDPNFWGLSSNVELLLPANRDTYYRLPAKAQSRSLVLQIGINSERSNTGTYGSANRSRIDILWAGAHRQEKALDIALKAFDCFMKMHPGTKAKLTVTGSGPESRRAQRLVAKLGIGTKVFFAGQISRQEYFETLSSADIFLFTSIHETTGVALLEAMQRGIPPVVIRRGGPGDIVTPDAGIAVEPTSTPEMYRHLAAAIGRLANDEELAEKLSQGAKVRAAQYSWTNRAEAIWQAYQSLDTERSLN